MERTILRSPIPELPGITEEGTMDITTTDYPEGFTTSRIMSDAEFDAIMDGLEGAIKIEVGKIARAKQTIMISGKSISKLRKRIRKMMELREGGDI